MKTAYGLPKKREEVVKELQVAFTQGNLDEFEYEKRLGKVYEATTLEELKDVVDDFPDLIKFKLFPSNNKPYDTSHKTASTNRPPIRRSSGRAAVNPRPTESTRVILSEQHIQLGLIEEKPQFYSNFLGQLKLNATRANVLTNACSIHVECFLGETRVNLMNPEFEGKHVEIYVHGALGEVIITVPKGVQITRNLRMYLGEFTLKRKSGKDLLGLFRGKKTEPARDIPFSLTIYGEFFLGSVKVVQQDLHQL